MTHSECRAMFIDVLYNQLTEQNALRFEEHCKDCAECRSEITKLRETLRVMNLRKHPEPDAQFWNRYWEELVPKLERKDQKRIIKFFDVKQFSNVSIPSWAYGIAAVVLVAVGIFLGRTYLNVVPLSNTRQEPTGVIASSSEDSVTAMAHLYLQRSKNLLIGMINTSDEHSLPADFAAQQQVSRDLIEKATYLKTALKDPDQRRLLQLVKDLEVILLQLANTEIKPGVPVVELVKSGVDQKSILLKINLEDMLVKKHRTDSSAKNDKHTL